MNSTTATHTIEVLRAIFSRNGLPTRVVSDNGPQFASKEFAEFLKANGVQHTFSAPYHPATNGSAERLVQTLKNSLKSMKEEGSLYKCVATFLLKYRTTPHTVTGETPAKLFMGRELRTRLSLLQSDPVQRQLQGQERTLLNCRRRTRSFRQGDLVPVKDYRGNQGWIGGKIKCRNGPVSYEVQVGDAVWRRHIDQLRDSRVIESTPHPKPFGNQPTREEPQLNPVSPERPGVPGHEETSQATTRGVVHPADASTPARFNVVPDKSSPTVCATPKIRPQRVRRPPIKLDL